MKNTAISLNPISADFLEQINEITDLTQADQALVNTLKKLGFNDFAFNLYPQNYVFTRQMKHDLHTDFIEPWHQFYITQNFDVVDPVMDKVLKNAIPVSWQLTEEIKHVDCNAQEMLAAAIDFNIREGISIPTYGPNGEYSILVLL